MHPRHPNCLICTAKTVITSLPEMSPLIKQCDCLMQSLGKGRMKTCVWLSDIQPPSTGIIKPPIKLESKCSYKFICKISLALLIRQQLIHTQLKYASTLRQAIVLHCYCHIFAIFLSYTLDAFNREQCFVAVTAVISEKYGDHLGILIKPVSHHQHFERLACITRISYYIMSSKIAYVMETFKCFLKCFSFTLRGSMLFEALCQVASNVPF